MLKVPAVAQGPRWILTNRHAASPENPSLIRFLARVMFRFHCRHRMARSFRRSQLSSSWKIVVFPAQVEVIHPPPQLRIRFLDGPGHAPSPPVFTDFPQGRLDPCYRFIPHFQAGFRRMPGHGVPKKCSAPRSVYRAFGLVDRELEPFRQETG